MSGIMIRIIMLYQIVRKYFPPQCRFSPSCSRYALEALEKYGFLRGSWMAAMRILRCHPYNPGGYDPVQ